MTKFVKARPAGTTKFDHLLIGRIGSSGPHSANRRRRRMFQDATSKRATASAISCSAVSALNHHGNLAGLRNGFRLSSFSMMAEMPFAKFDLEKAIALRWALRDIVAKRLRLTPVSEDDLRILTELGYVEMRDGTPMVTQAGLDALD
jgi:hypothetical protein